MELLGGGLRGVGDHNLNKVLFVDITHILYSVDSKLLDIEFEFPLFIRANWTPLPCLTCVI